MPGGRFPTNAEPALTREEVALLNRKLLPADFGDKLYARLTTKDQKEAIPAAASLSNPLVMDNDSRIPTADQTASFPTGASGSDQLVKASQIVSLVDGALYSLANVQAALSATPTAIWTLDNGSLADLSGNGYTLTVGAGSFLKGTTPIRGKTGLRGDGTSYLTNAAAVFQAGAAISYCCLLSMDTLDLSTSRMIVGCSSTGATANIDANQWGLWVGSTGIMYHGAESSALSEVGVDGNQVHAPVGSYAHICVTRDGSQNVKIYINGILAGSGTESGALGTGTNTALRIGSYNTGRGLEGVVSNVVVHVGTEWTADQVLAMAKILKPLAF